MKASSARQKLCIVSPYYGKFTLNLRKQLRTFLVHTYPQINFQFAFRTVEKIRTRFRVKDLIPIVLSSNVIYRYKCHCCDAMYIGKTCRHFGTREQNIPARTGKPIQPDANSAINRHYRETGHTLHYDNFTIIDRAENQYFTHIKEALNIVQQKPSLNGQIDQPFLMLLQI